MHVRDRMFASDPGASAHAFCLEPQSSLMPRLLMRLSDSCAPMYKARMWLTMLPGLED